jgi:predicted AAA+ superfamily ATPase
MDELLISKSFGNVFETFIVSQFYKNYVHSGKNPNFTYFRDSNDNEIDFIENYKSNSFYYEIKSAMTFKPEFVSTMLKILGENDKKYLIYRGDMNITYKTVNILPWNEIDFNIS